MIGQFLPVGRALQLCKTTCFSGDALGMAFARFDKSASEIVMSISLSSALPSSSGTLATSPFATQSSSTQSAAPAETAAQKFLEYANMTPAQRLHAQMLAKLGLTEDQFNAMSPADQQKIDDKIREMIKQQIDTTGDNRPGMITDKSA
jgi:hypothetical protein